KSDIASMSPQASTAADGSLDGLDGGGPLSHDSCTAVLCNNPPSGFCIDITTLRKFSQNGMCTAGLCSYGHTDVTCENGCSVGACQGSDSCGGVVCQSPPPPNCVDPM